MATVSTTRHRRKWDARLIISIIRLDGPIVYQLPPTCRKTAKNGGFPAYFSVARFDFPSATLTTFPQALAVVPMPDIPRPNADLTE
jgi:hypothetical protein